MALAAEVQYVKIRRRNGNNPKDTAEKKEQKKVNEFHRKDELPKAETKAGEEERSWNWPHTSPLETRIDSSCVKTPNALKDFLSSMQPTPNALTYQAWTHRALCPHITDFLLRTNGKTRSCVSGLCGLTNLFLWVLCVFGVGGGNQSQHWDIVFPITGKATAFAKHRHEDIGKEI